MIRFPQAAQEREDLQKTGDDLDAKIRKAEKEIRYNPTCSEGQCHSQRYYYIWMTYRLLLYQLKGVCVCVRHCRAMENTLRLMNSRNANFRKSLTKVDKSGE